MGILILPKAILKRKVAQVGLKGATGIFFPCLNLFFYNSSHMYQSTKTKACIPPETAFALGNSRVPNAEKAAQTTSNVHGQCKPQREGTQHVGLALGPWGLALGLWGFVLGPRGFSDTNMLVYYR